MHVDPGAEDEPGFPRKTPHFGRVHAPIPRGFSRPPKAWTARRYFGVELTRAAMRKVTPA